MDENINIDQFFKNNSSSNEFIQAQLKDANDFLTKAGIELSEAASKQVSLFQKISDYGSLPIGDRYSLVPALTLYEQYRASLRILLDDLNMLGQMVDDPELKKRILHTKIDCFTLLSTIVEMLSYLDAAINQEKIETDVSIHF